MGGWRNDQEALKPREVQPALASVIQQSSLCLSVTYMFCVYLLSFVKER